jgi:hypothetical protein
MANKKKDDKGKIIENRPLKFSKRPCPVCNSDNTWDLPKDKPDQKRVKSICGDCNYEGDFR